LGGDGAKEGEGEGRQREGKVDERNGRWG